MILGELAREERVLVIVSRARDGLKPLYAVPHPCHKETPVIALTATPSPMCLFEDRQLAELIAYALEAWGFTASVRRVSMVTTVEDARPEPA